MKIENEWEMCTSVEDIIFRESETGRNYSLKTLQSVYKDFKRLIKKCTFQLPPSFILDELVENGVKTYVFIYRCTDKDGNEIKNMLVSKTTDCPSVNWSIHQVLSIMQDMYILKLNDQLINKLN
jgi:hypothetical protein